MEGLSTYNALISFAGGILSFLSPCVFPLVPGYISMISGVSINELKGEAIGSTANARRAVITNSLAFNAGLSLIFLILGGTAGLIGSALLNNIWVRIIGGIVIIVFGLQMLGLFKIRALYKDTRFLDNNAKPAGFFSAFTLGLAFAAGWTPCIGPILGGIIGLAATSGGWQSGLILSLFYSLGLAIPFLLVGVFFGAFLSFFKSFKRHLHTVELLSGVLLVAIGFLVATGSTTWLNSSSVAAVLPDWESRLSLRENKPPTSEVEAQSSNQAIVQYPAAPPIVFETLDGKIQNVNDLRGRVVLINLWATWCVPCRHEIPSLNALQKQYENEGLSVIGVSFDSQDTANKVKEFQQDVAMNYTTAIGKEPSPNDLYVGLPKTFIIDRNGRLRKTIEGARTLEQFEAEIKPLLTEGAETARK